MPQDDRLRLAPPPVAPVQIGRASFSGWPRSGPSVDRVPPLASLPRCAVLSGERAASVAASCQDSTHADHFGGQKLINRRSSCAVAAHRVSGQTSGSRSRPLLCGRERFVCPGRTVRIGSQLPLQRCELLRFRSEFLGVRTQHLRRGTRQDIPRERGDIIRTGRTITSAVERHARGARQPARRRADHRELIRLVEDSGAATGTRSQSTPRRRTQPS